MAAGRLIFPGLMPIIDASGDRVAGAKAYFYANLTETLALVYTDATLTVPLSNPVVADGVGVWPAMWADTSILFSVAITDATGAPIPSGTWDSVSAAIDATLASADLADIARAAAVVAETGAQTAQGAAEASEGQAAAYAAAISGAPFNATSATPTTIGTGSKTIFLTQLGKLFSVGQTIVDAETSNAAVNAMTGTITAFDPTTGEMTFNVPAGGAIGAGTHADWTISLSSSGGVQSVAGLTGPVSAPALKAALGVTAADIIDFNHAADARAIAFAAAL